MKLNNIDMLLKEERTLKEKYEQEKETIKLKPVKLSHQLIFGSLAQLSAMAYANLNGIKFDGVILMSFGAYSLGICMPSLIKKIRIADKDYQIYMINKNIEFLEEQRIKVMHR